jgi:hypothetical protein
MTMSRWWKLNPLLLALVVAACAGGGEPVQEVSRISVSVDESCAATANVSVGIGACDELLPPVLERRGRDLHLAIEIEPRSASETCILLLVGVDVEAPLGVLEGGDYRLHVDAELGAKSHSFSVDPSCP